MLQIKKYCNTRVCAVVKANAYGHGMVKTAAALFSHCDMFAVSRYCEARELRSKIKNKPILILADLDVKNLKFTSQNDIALCVASVKQLVDIVSKLKKIKLLTKQKIHIKVNTGMNRLGITKVSELKQILQLVSLNSEILKVTGVLTHMCNCDDAEYTENQFKTFLKFVKVCKKYDNDIIAHCASSDAIFLNKKYHLDMVRPGIALYGACKKSERVAVKLLPAMQAESSVIFCGKLKAGQTVGYGCNYTAEKDINYAVIGAGYADGYKRINSNCGYVSINGYSYQIIGNVCMDLIIIESDKNVKENDTAVLLSNESINEVNFENSSNNSKTIIYELFTSFTRAERFYIN